MQATTQSVIDDEQFPNVFSQVETAFSCDIYYFGDYHRVLRYRKRDGSFVLEKEANNTSALPWLRFSAVSTHQLIDPDGTNHIIVLGLWLIAKDEF